MTGPEFIYTQKLKEETLSERHGYTSTEKSDKKFGRQGESGARHAMVAAARHGVGGRLWSQSKAVGNLGQEEKKKAMGWE